MLATCNRVEIYADVDRFHGSVEAVSRLLVRARRRGARGRRCRTSTCTTTTARSRTCSTSPPASTRWSSARARSSARPARRCGSARSTAPSAPPLNVLFQQALRVGKRVARRDRHRPRRARRWSPPRWTAPPTHVGALAGKRVLVVGAGSMAGLAAATAVPARRRRDRRREPHADRAARLAEQYAARAVALTASPPSSRPPTC